MNLTNQDRNIIRTLAPAVVGAVVTYVAKVYASLDATEQAIVFPVATTSYYTVIRFLEEKFPKASWLLGCLPVKAADETLATPEVSVPTASEEPAK